MRNLLKKTEVVALTREQGVLLTPESSNERTVLRSSEHMLLSGALVVRLSQVASELALGLKPPIKPSIIPLVTL